MDEQTSNVTLPRVEGLLSLPRAVVGLFVTLVGGLLVAYVRQYTLTLLLAGLGGFVGFLLVVPTFGVSVPLGLALGGAVGYRVDGRRHREDWHFE